MRLLIRRKGYVPVFYDGTYYELPGIKLKITPKIKRHRPDLIGVHPKTKKICICEAKTEGDFYSKTTQEELVDFCSTKTKSNEKVDFYIGIPKKEEKKLHQLLGKLKINQKKITIIPLDEALISDAHENTL